MPAKENFFIFLWHIYKFKMYIIIKYISKGLKATEKLMKADYKDSPSLPFWLMTVRCGQHVNQAYVRCCDGSLSSLTEMEQETES